MAASFLRIKELLTGYNGKALTPALNMDIEKGEIVSVIGPNGSGKTTLLKTLSRQIDRVGGSIFIRDKEIAEFSLQELSREVALLLTDRVSPDYMTGLEIVETGRYPYTGSFGLLTDDDRKKVDEAVDIAEVRELSGRRFITLSDGEKQRVLFARAIAQEPEILILDEPMSFLDIRYRIRMLKILSFLSREKGMTVIMSDHELRGARGISDKVIAIKGRSFIKTGAPDEVFKKDVLMELYDLSEEEMEILRAAPSE